MEGAMAKALEVNDNHTQNIEGEQDQPPGEKRNKQKPQGKALQVNEDNVEGQESTKSPVPRP
jgi:hypothetical protein